jgi:hypothetical protein
VTLNVLRESEIIETICRKKQTKILKKPNLKEIMVNLHRQKLNEHLNKGVFLSDKWGVPQ